MRSIAHIVNPLKASPPSDLYSAQPITFESMRLARDFTSGTIDVQLLSAQFAEDREAVPPYFIKTTDLTHSVLDIRSFELPRKLPLIKDILDRVVDETDAEFIVYTNVDIGLMPHFYMTMNWIIQSGVDGALITRRTLPAQPFGVEDLPIMWANFGERHPGSDCFLFHRDVYPRFRLGTVCIGAPGVGQLLLANIVRFSRRYKEFRKHHLTFHVGQERTWRDPRYQDYIDHNREQAALIMTELSKGLPNDHPFVEWQSRPRLGRRARRSLSRMRNWVVRRLGGFLVS